MTADQMRAEAVRLMKSRAKKNKYTNGGNRKYFLGKPEGAARGYSDCSSAVRACIKRAAGIDIGANTDAQIRNRKNALMVHKATGNEVGPPLDLLKPADLIYYKGNVAHTWNVGHVEMVTGPNELYGHGGGMGPNKHDLKAYSKKRRAAGKGYLCVLRFIKDDAVPAPEPTMPAHGIRITGNSVNLRTGPSTDYPSVDVVDAGTILEKVDTEWFPIVKDNRVLWVSNKYSKEV